MTDAATVRTVVWFLGALALIYTSGLIWLVSVGTPADRLAIVAGPGGMVIGGLCTLLASTKSGPTPGVSTIEQTTTTLPQPSQPADPF
jgi:hypothetical protein